MTKKQLTILLIIWFVVALYLCTLDLPMYFYVLYGIVGSPILISLQNK